MSGQVKEQLARLEHEIVAKIKGMIARGDVVDDIAVWFGINARVVQAIIAGAGHPFVEPAPRWALPPPGPYTRVPHVYGALREVRDAERRLRHEAAALRNKYMS